MVNTQLIRSVIVKNGDTQALLASALGLAVSALNARIHGQVDFRRKEINLIRKRYNLSPEETMDIFFSEAVS